MNRARILPSSLNTSETKDQKKRTILRATAAKAENSFPKIPSCNDEPALGVTGTVALLLAVVVGVFTTMVGVVVTIGVSTTGVIVDAMVLRAVGLTSGFGSAEVDSTGEELVAGV